MAGGEYVGFNNSVFLAEREVSDRNYALAYYMRENKCFPKGSNIKDCLDFWYQVLAKSIISMQFIIIYIIKICVQYVDNTLYNYTLLVLLYGSQLRGFSCDRRNFGQWWSMSNFFREGHKTRSSS